jgi:hypothetical protein
VRVLDGQIHEASDVLHQLDLIQQRAAAREGLRLHYQAKCTVLTEKLNMDAANGSQRAGTQVAVADRTKFAELDSVWIEIETSPIRRAHARGGDANE